MATAECPECRKAYPTPKKQLQGKKVQIFCTECKKKFSVPPPLNAKPAALVMEAEAKYVPKPERKRKSVQKKKSSNYTNPINTGDALTKNGDEAITVIPLEPAPAPGRLPWETEKKSFNVNWFAGFMTGLVLLLGQAFYFEHKKWPQNSTYRPYLENLCQWLGCQVTEYENLAEFAVLHGSFTPNADNIMVFKAVIKNQSPFRQRLPNIKLTLLDYNEQLFAQRIFAPKDYLADTKRIANFMAADETIEATLPIATPKTPIGGYNFDLVY